LQLSPKVHKPSAGTVFFQDCFRLSQNLFQSGTSSSWCCTESRSLHCTALPQYFTMAQATPSSQL